MNFAEFGALVAAVGSATFNEQVAGAPREDHAVHDVFRPSRAAQRRVRLAEQREAEDWPEEWSRDVK